MSTEVIRSQVIPALNTELDKIDTATAEKDTQISMQAGEIGDLTAAVQARDETIVARDAEIADLEQRLADCEASNPPPPPEPTPPVNLTPPVWNGTPVVGVSITVTPPTWESDTPVIIVSRRILANGVFVETDSGYSMTPKAAVIGKVLTYEETVKNDVGPTTVTSALSAPVKATADEPDPEPDPVPDPEPGPDPTPIPGDAINVHVFYKPEATGDGSGSSPENCAAITTLAAKIAAGGPGKTHGLLASNDVWPSFGTSLSVGGAPGAPVTITGVGEDRVPKLVTLSSGRPPLNEAYYAACNEIDPNGSWGPPETGGGANFLNLNKGANSLAVKFIELRNYNYLIRVNQTIADLALDDILLRNVKEGVWMDNAIDPGETLKRAINKLRVKRWRMYGFEIGMRLLGTTNDVLIEGVEMDSRRVQGHISFGFTIGSGDAARSDVVHHLTIIGDAFGMSGIVKNFHDTHFEKPWHAINADGTRSAIYSPVDSHGFTPPGSRQIVRNPDEWGADLSGGADGVPGDSYWNGDPFSTERTCHTITLEGLDISGSCDAGMDLKSLNTTVRRVVSRDNKKNFRPRGTTSDAFPQGQMFEDCTSISARKRGGNSGPEHMGIAGNTAAGQRPVKLSFTRCHFQGSPSRAFSTDPEHKWGIQMTQSGCTSDGPSLTSVPFIA